MIVDAHTHLGQDTVFEEDFTLEKLLKGLETGKVDASIVQPGTVFDLKTVMKQHDFIAERLTNNLSKGKSQFFVYFVAS